MTARGPEGFSAYAHCSKGASGYTLLLVNFDGDNATLTLPEHGTRAEYVLTSPDGLDDRLDASEPASRKDGAQRRRVLAVSNGELPALLPAVGAPSARRSPRCPRPQCLRRHGEIADGIAGAEPCTQPGQHYSSTPPITF